MQEEERDRETVIINVKAPFRYAMGVTAFTFYIGHVIQSRSSGSKRICMSKCNIASAIHKKLSGRGRHHCFANNTEAQILFLLLSKEREKLFS